MVDFLLGAVAFAAGSFLVKKVYDYFTTPKITYQPHNKENHSGTANAERTFEAIRAANQEIEELRAKARIDRYLHEKDHEQIADLQKKIDSLYGNYEVRKHKELLEQVDRKSSDFGEYQIKPETLNIIQYHVGETVLNKKCPACHKPMVLQFRRDRIIINLDDFFWACTGYYSHECRNTENFRLTDTKLFTQRNKPEIEITNAELAKTFNDPTIQKNTATRMTRHRNQQVQEYVCPIHKEPLILRQKNYHSGITDQFFLSCPRWKHPDDANYAVGCHYVLKLKSPAQLASYLRKAEGKGIL